MSERTNRTFDCEPIAVYGFTKEDNAEVILEVFDESHVICLGDVRGCSDEEIDRLFVESLTRYARIHRNAYLADIADRMVEDAAS